MTVAGFLEDLKKNPRANTFERSIRVIEENYIYRPTAFTNGKYFNESGQNEGSCKIFGFAKQWQLSEQETLACFGDYYFKDVLDNPGGEGHQNIRNFMETGWEGINFKENPLQEK